ncbi:hypothetical protein POM88_015937 [Heracleum sosnowskyi]|uniref:Protein kinase domain-containing protein n=1 Tax=Heracleum sosnowskyi TaxID=360622 RepID=A0AAD8IKS1_9APIA|nr:hypothetical protein POM88_015937 [Heracleum sosnowskyi]
MVASSIWFLVHVTIMLSEGKQLLNNSFHLIPQTAMIVMENYKAENVLSVATRNFHPDSVIGEGAFGRVYKGWVDGNTFAAAKWGTGLVIAIKRYKTQANKEWLTKINSLGKLCHPNIVKLIGYCIDKKHRLLVYEYMPHGSLDTHLFKRDSDFQPLSWKLRISIALGAAKGLAYLHC